MIRLPTTKKTKGTNAKEFLTLHHTGSNSPTMNVASYLATNKAQVSCHYLVGTNGEVVKIGEDDDILWHAGKSSCGKKTGLNKYSIGIEVNSLGENFTKEQKTATKELILSLMAKYKIPKENILRHKDITPRKWDIGDDFWNKEYKTWEDYQNSLTKYAMLLNETIMLLKSLWGDASDENKVKIGEQAKKLRKAQEALGEDVTK